MTIFASTPPINDDPEPWQSPYAPDHRAGWALAYDDSRWNPRPEYDRPRAHEANPILLAYRNYLLTYRLTDAADYWLFALEALEFFGGFVEWDRPESTFHSLTTATRGQLDHARRVLTRLAEFEVSV